MGQGGPVIHDRAESFLFKIPGIEDKEFTTCSEFKRSSELVTQFSGGSKEPVDVRDGKVTYEPITLTRPARGGDIELETLHQRVIDEGSENVRAQYECQQLNGAQEVIKRTICKDAFVQEYRKGGWDANTSANLPEVVVIAFRKFETILQ